MFPVTCGSSRGTAFYIGEQRFLTAWHVVSDAEAFQEPISLIINGETRYCQLIKLNEMDAAVLHCEEVLPDIVPIELLKTDFIENAELEIIGYPQEIGNGVDYFGVQVKNLKKMTDLDHGFDVMVLRTDPFGFKSYSGFSGSPVLNAKGVAVGVVTDQMHNTLGYTSVAALADELWDKKIKLLEEVDRYDMRPIGIGRCEELAQEACLRMRGRYVKENHVENEELETRLEVFCGYNEDRWERQFREEMREWTQTVGKTIKTAVDKLIALNQCLSGGDINFDTARDMELLLNKRISAQSEAYFVNGKWRDRLLEISDLMDVAQDAKVFSQERFLYIYGDAGCGKTQHMCHFVEELSQYRNVYLLFATDFNLNDNPIVRIKRALHWEEEYVLDNLNDELKKKGRYATIIIDALNEGEGTSIWNTLLPTLKAEIERFSNLKLIVTVRTMEPGDQLNKQFENGWEKVEIKGFSDLNKAISMYFEGAKINEKAENFLSVKEFRRPLFLKLFCQVYHQLPYEYRREIDILRLYHYYYVLRNEEVSHLADEDPEKMVVPSMMIQIGSMSLKGYDCSDVPREKVIDEADKMCPNRLWSKNLYHALLTENLLMEYRTTKGLKTTFQYDSMGDYMRALCIMLENENDEQRFLEVMSLVDRVSDGEISYTNRNHIRNTVKTFLSVWNPSQTIWQRSEFKNGKLAELLLESLELRNMNSGNSTLPKEMVADIVLSKEDYFNPSFLLANFTLYKEHLVEPIHERLIKMGMVERDEMWTLKVNQMQDDHSYFYKIRNISLESTEEAIRAYLSLVCWLFTSSHPQLRNLVARVVQGWLRQFSQLCVELIEKFHTCNDPYVLRGVYGSVYGVLLVTRDAALSHKVAEMVYDYLYKDYVNVPTELEVRSWTLKILELNFLLNPGDSYWNDATPPYPREDNLLEFPSGELFDDGDYFGEGGGARKLHHSLFHWDFYRYIIGRNSDNKSRTYFKDEIGVDLDVIAKGVAYRIKHTYGYSRKLSEYDNSVKWEESVYRQTERIGKKYQWIALGEVKAFLSDTCQMSKEWWDEKTHVKVPYPWNDSITVTFDPTLTLEGNRSYLDQELFDEVPGEDLMIGKAREWLDNKEFVPKPILVVQDKNGSEWVNVVGYQKQEQSKDDDKRETFVYFRPCHVKNEYADAFENWAKSQCFFGNLMPEDSGHYEFFWNEFPWSDSYLSMGFEEELEVYGHRKNAPCKVSLPYAAQLQEYYEGIDDKKEFEGMVYSPSEDMFKFFGLHTAERGITRDGDDNVVALCRNIQGDILDTMVMKRDLLNRYLEEKGMTLFYCMPADKSLTQDPQQYFRQRFSCCLRYTPYGEPIVVQPMTDERDFSDPEPKADEVATIDGVSQEDWSAIIKEGGEPALIDFINDYVEMLIEREKKRSERDDDAANK